MGARATQWFQRFTPPTPVSHETLDAARVACAYCEHGHHLGMALYPEDDGSEGDIRWRWLVDPYCEESGMEGDGWPLLMLFGRDHVNWACLPLLAVGTPNGSILVLKRESDVRSWASMFDEARGIGRRSELTLEAVPWE